MSQINGAKILGDPLTMQRCERCGGELPISPGQWFKNCEDWGQQLAAKLPRPIPLALLLDLKMNGQLCRITEQINNEAAYVAELASEFSNKKGG